MGKLGFLSSVLSYQLLLLLILIILNIVAYGEETQDFYIVYLGDSPVSKQSAVQKHIGLLSSVKGSQHGAKESIVYSYTKSFNAFAAKLSEDEAEMLKASGIDRQFMSTVKLGNGKSFSGIGINTFESKENFYSIVSGADVARNSGSKENARFCLPNTLDPGKVKGRLVYCTLGQWGVDSVVKGIGGIGTIVESEQYLDIAQIFMAPATIVNSTVGETIQNYIHSTSSPSAVVYKSEEVEVPAPVVASFSSRGPNPGSRLVLKVCKL
ncbi:hypothetical protein V6N11_083762 [Hibiscus sabdariffa]|uniref:Inhibitor I9 domain-containing protein n=1 Tax=Hibiscus sabdariffa TaxID=183260 RepID=A0ABR2QCZ8_9ROSI